MTGATCYHFPGPVSPTYFTLNPGSLKDVYNFSGLKRTPAINCNVAFIIIILPHPRYCPARCSYWEARQWIPTPAIYFPATKLDWTSGLPIYIFFYKNKKRNHLSNDEISILISIMISNEVVNKVSLLQVYLLKFWKHSYLPPFWLHALPISIF